jgi:hypothetical protein
LADEFWKSVVREAVFGRFDDRIPPDELMMGNDRLDRYITIYTGKELMDEAKKRMIEARLCELIAQAERVDLVNSPAKSRACGTRVIRRRKGKPDVRIAGEQPVWGAVVMDGCD